MGSSLLDPGGPDPFPDGVPEGIGMEAGPVTGQEEGPFRGVDLQLRPHFLEVTFAPVHRAGTHRNDPVFLAFAEPDGQRPGFPVEVIDFEPRQLASPDCRGIEQLQYGPIPDSEFVVDVRNGQHLVNLGS